MRLFSGTPWDVPPRCERCAELIEACQCPPAPPPRIAPQDQTAKIVVEKRQKAKLVTVIRGLPEKGNDLPALLTELKSACASGGTVKEETLEVQGSHLDRVRTVLKKMGYRVQG